MNPDPDINIDTYIHREPEVCQGKSVFESTSKLQWGWISARECCEAIEAPSLQPTAYQFYFCSGSEWMVQPPSL